MANFLDEYFRENNIPEPSHKRSYYKFAQSYAFLSPLRPVFDIDMDMCLSYNKTCGLNLDVIQSKAMPVSCTDFLKDVTYLGQKKKCEEILKLEHTSAGICFTTSTIKLPLIYTRSNNRAIQLSIEYAAPEGYGLDVSNKFVKKITIQTSKLCFPLNLFSYSFIVLENPLPT